MIGPVNCGFRRLLMNWKRTRDYRDIDARHQFRDGDGAKSVARTTPKNRGLACFDPYWPALKTAVA
jgi:hypothetical protein